MAKSDPTPQTYALIEGVHSVVLPSDVAVQVFQLLCQGQPVSYDWQSKVYKRNRDSVPLLKVFTLRDYATLQLEED